MTYGFFCFLMACAFALVGALFAGPVGALLGLVLAVLMA